MDWRTRSSYSGERRSAVPTGGAYQMWQVEPSKTRTRYLTRFGHVASFPPRPRATGSFIHSNSDFAQATWCDAAAARCTT